MTATRPIKGRRLIPLDRISQSLSAGVIAGALLTGIAAHGAAAVITNIAMVPRLTIQSPVGVTNQILYRTNLTQTNWLVLTNLLATQTQYWFVDITAPPAPQRFYGVVVPVDTNTTVTLKQLWGSAGRTNTAATLIQRTSIPTPVNTAAAAFDATHPSIWIPMSYIPAWSVGTLVSWGSSPYTMRVASLGTGEIRFTVASGGYFGWSPGTLIVTSFSYSLSNVVTAASRWVNPGVGNTVEMRASAVTASVGDVVWVGGVGANQFQITGIVK
jgi:hypothetical protein